MTTTDNVEEILGDWIGEREDGVRLVHYLESLGLVVCRATAKKENHPVVETGPILRFAQEDTEKFELLAIELSAGSWPTSFTSSIFVLKGQELVIRQDRHHVEVIRRVPSGWRTDFENMPDDKTICFFWKDGHHDALAGAVCAMSFGHKNTKWVSPPSHWAIIGPPVVSS